jgi:hypothetical protein
MDTVWYVDGFALDDMPTVHVERVMVPIDVDVIEWKCDSLLVEREPVGRQTGEQPRGGIDV